MSAKKSNSFYQKIADGMQQEALPEMQKPLAFFTILIMAGAELLCVYLCGGGWRETALSFLVCPVSIVCFSLLRMLYRRPWTLALPLAAPFLSLTGFGSARRALFIGLIVFLSALLYSSLRLAGASRFFRRLALILCGVCVLLLLAGNGVHAAGGLSAWLEAGRVWFRETMPLLLPAVDTVSVDWDESYYATVRFLPFLFSFAAMVPAALTDLLCVACCHLLRCETFFAPSYMVVQISEEADGASDQQPKQQEQEQEQQQEQEQAGEEHRIPMEPPLPAHFGVLSLLVFLTSLLLRQPSLWQTAAANCYLVFAVPCAAFWFRRTGEHLDLYIGALSSLHSAYPAQGGLCARPYRAFLIAVLLAVLVFWVLGVSTGFTAASLLGAVKAIRTHLHSSRYSSTTDAR